MPRRVTAIATPIAHLVGPGKIKVVNGQLAFSTDDGKPIRLQPKELRFIFCYGPVGVSDRAFELLWKFPVQLAWLDAGGGRCRGRVARSEPERTGSRLRQYAHLLNSESSLRWGRRIVVAKVESQVAAARHFQRHGFGNPGDALPLFADALRRLESADDLDAVRGVEGSASAAWFRLLAGALPEGWEFRQRVRRPPTDPVNALLSLGYTFLLNRTIARVEAVGLEVYLGGLHAYRPGRPSLACDLMEPLRVPAVDRWLVQLLRRNQLNAGDFETDSANGVRLTKASFAKVLATWEEQFRHGGHDDRLLEWVEWSVRQFGTPERVDEEE